MSNLQSQIAYTVADFVKNINTQAQKIITLREALHRVFEIKKHHESISSYSASLKIFTEQHQIEILWSFSAEIFDRDWQDPKQHISFFVHLNNELIKITTAFEEIVPTILKAVGAEK